MTAFDRAWGVVKMPIVPGSVYRNYEYDDGDFKRYGAAFDDPKTGERMNMQAVYHPNDSISATINSLSDDTLATRASGDFTVAGDSEDYERPRFEATMIGTNDKYRRRGYATAIYDLIAYILDRHGTDLTPSLDQTYDGGQLWEPVMGDLEDDEPERWRIRGDLG